MSTPRILVVDLETSPLEVFSWGIFDQNIGLNQIKEDWSILSFAAKWYGEPETKIFYTDTSNKKNVRDDKELVTKLWKLVNEADILLTQNGNSFDIKKMNARFAHHGLTPPSSYKKIDTKVLCKRHFGFTSNSLEYLTQKFCKKFKKQKHNKFPGMELWKECLKKNKEAWKEMKTYNIWDILSLEELYQNLQAWDNTSPNFNLYSNSKEQFCNCGGKEFTRNGFAYTASAKYQRYVCKDCGKESRDTINLITKEQRQKLKRNIPR